MILESVAKKKQLIMQIKHGLTIASDELVNECIYRRFLQWSFLYPRDEAQLNLMQDTAFKFASLWNDRVKLAGWASDYCRFDYSPIHNYDRTETGTDTIAGSDTNTGTIGTATQSMTTDNSAYGYNSSTDQPDTKSVVNGTVTQTNNLTSTNSGNTTHNLRIFGNIGVTTTATMLSEEDKRLENYLSTYVDKFAECFILSL